MSIIMHAHDRKMPLFIKHAIITCRLLYRFSFIKFEHEKVWVYVQTPTIKSGLNRIHHRATRVGIVMTFTLL